MAVTATECPNDESDAGGDSGSPARPLEAGERAVLDWLIDAVMRQVDSAGDERNKHG